MALTTKFYLDTTTASGTYSNIASGFANFISLNNVDTASSSAKSAVYTNITNQANSIYYSSVKYTVPSGRTAKIIFNISNLISTTFTNSKLLLNSASYCYSAYAKSASGTFSFYASWSNSTSASYLIIGSVGAMISGIPVFFSSFASSFSYAGVVSDNISFSTSMSASASSFITGSLSSSYSTNVSTIQQSAIIPSSWVFFAGPGHNVQIFYKIYASYIDQTTNYMSGFVSAIGFGGAGATTSCSFSLLQSKNDIFSAVHTSSMSFVTIEESGS